MPTGGVQLRPSTVVSALFVRERDCYGKWTFRSSTPGTILSRTARCLCLNLFKSAQISYTRSQTVTGARFRP